MQHLAQVAKQAVSLHDWLSVFKLRTISVALSERFLMLSRTVNFEVVAASVKKIGEIAPTKKPLV